MNVYADLFITTHKSELVPLNYIDLFITTHKSELVPLNYIDLFITTHKFEFIHLYQYFKFDSLLTQKCLGVNMGLRIL